MGKTADKLFWHATTEKVQTRNKHLQNADSLPRLLKTEFLEGVSWFLLIILNINCIEEKK